MTVLLVAGCTMALATGVAPAPQSGVTNADPSTFVIPSNPQEGRDPFFPDSTRPYKLAAPAVAQVADVTSLVVKGFSGSVDRRFVIINNHTFAAGDEGDVVTRSGRIHLSCLEIKTNSVVIEVGSQRHELFYSDQP
ncbi:MAG TPA: hypothetical protein VMA35_01450 [Candidatus Sulfopaludibacter sp.]|nr:hypothetical protein [Candidatus Sulfopaludibacter sp.]